MSRGDAGSMTAVVKQDVWSALVTIQRPGVKGHAVSLASETGPIQSAPTGGTELPLDHKPRGPLPLPLPLFFFTLKLL